MSDELGAVQEQTFAGATRATAESYPRERRLSARQLAAYLDWRAFAVIGSRRPDGRPHAAMCSYVRRGRDFWLPTMAGSVRERNLRAEPWMTMTVTEGDRDSPGQPLPPLGPGGQRPRRRPARRVAVAGILGGGSSGCSCSPC